MTTASQRLLYILRHERDDQLWHALPWLIDLVEAVERHSKTSLLAHDRLSPPLAALREQLEANA